VPLRLSVGLAAGGGVCMVADLLLAFLVADHSSSDSSPSSLIAIALGSIGALAVLVGVLLFVGIALGRLWRWGHRTPETSG
jgi:hypothetical protein